MAVTNSLIVDSHTVADGYRQRIRLSSSERAYNVKRDGKFEPVLWQEIHEKVLGLFASLQKHGIQKGDSVAILAATSPEWNMTDISILCTGAITVPIYPSSTTEDVSFILKNSEAKLLFVDEPSHKEKIVTALRQLGTSLPIVCFKEAPPAFDDFPVQDFADFAKNPNTPENLAAFEQSIDAIQKEDTASIVYTSGTTGTPKGVVVTHGNMTSCLRAVIDEIKFTSSDQLLTFLPFAHILGRMESFAPIFSGIGMGFAENMSTIAADIKELQPTILVSVPRIYEKIYTKILSEIESASPTKQKIFRWAEAVGREYVVLLSEKQPIPVPLQLKYAVADKLVFTKIRNKLGGKIKLTASGGAPLARNICEFFHACGIKILEGYGLTETMGPILVNHPNHYRFGTVGTPIGDGQVRIAPDGEILLKGSMVSSSYFKNEEATRASFLEGGWFCSGDIGELDDQGFLKITDRKKELIVTAGGKNIAPQKIENLIKLIPFVSNCMTYGDQKKYVVALLTLDPDSVANWAKVHGVAFSSPGELAQNNEVISAVEAEIKRANGQLASYETVKKFKIVADEWAPETGELTPSLKLKRKVITERYRNEIDKLY